LSNDAAFQLSDIHSLDIEPPFELRERELWLAAAGEDVHRRVAVLRPRVDGHVRFREEHDRGNAVRRKGVGAHVEHVELAPLARGAQGVLNQLRIV
jgi:hypothetical protein